MIHIQRLGKVQQYLGCETFTQRGRTNKWSFRRICFSTACYLLYHPNPSSLLWVLNSLVLRIKAVIQL